MPWLNYESDSIRTHTSSLYGRIKFVKRYITILNLNRTILTLNRMSKQGHNRTKLGWKRYNLRSK